MATTEQHSNVIAGTTTAADEQLERDAARKLAERYRYAFVDLREQRIDPELFRTIPADLMFRYNFVPLETHDNVLSIAAADPGQVQMSDELPLLLGKKLSIKVATARQISDLLKRSKNNRFHQAHNGADGGIAREAIAGNRLFALFFVFRNLQCECFGGLLQNTLGLFGALEQIADLPCGGHFDR